QDIDVAHARVRRYDVLGQRCGHETAGTVRHRFSQQRHADSHGDAADDLTAGGLRVENPAAIDGRHDSGDPDRSEIRIDVDLDELCGESTCVRPGARRWGSEGDEATLADPHRGRRGLTGWRALRFDGDLV